MSLDIEAIKSRADAATQGPWHKDHDEFGCAQQGDYGWVCGGPSWPAYDEDSEQGHADAEFIAHARTDVPGLLAEVERLAEALQQSVARECTSLCKDLESDRDEWERRAKAAQAELAAMNTAIGFDTNCLSCAATLKGSAEQTMRAEKAEAERDNHRAQIGRALDACDRMMAGTLSPSYIVAEVRGALGAELVAGHTKSVAEVKAAYCDSRHTPDHGRYELQCELMAGHGGNHVALQMMNNPVTWETEAVAEKRSLHIGRSWVGHELEDGCPCPQAPCGLVDTDTIDPDCPEHALPAAKSSRQGHWADECPGRRQCPEALLLSPDEVIVIQCVRAGGHEGNHWNRDREIEWEPIDTAAEGLSSSDTTETAVEHG